VADKDGNLKEGDLITNINGIPLDNLNLKEAKKLIEAAKERLDLVIRRPPGLTTSRSNHNIYLQSQNQLERKNNLIKGNLEAVGAPPRPPLPHNGG
jgi:C-terminal processing protease CtpA/Prc